MTPNTRLEKWLAKIAGESVDIQPKDRLETLLAKIAGDDVSITPDDSLEYWSNQIAENGGGGGSATRTVTYVPLQSCTPQLMDGAYVAMFSEVGDPPYEPSIMSITCDGVSYECEPSENGSYGAPMTLVDDLPTFDFSEYPFCLFAANGMAAFEDANVHTFSATYDEQAVFPEGELSIDQNGVYDCREYATANVYIPTPSIELTGSCMIMNSSSTSIDVYTVLIDEQLNIKFNRVSVPSKQGFTIAIPMPFLASSNGYFPVVKIRNSINGKPSTPPTVDKNGEVLTGADCYYISVADGATITVTN